MKIMQTLLAVLLVLAICTIGSTKVGAYSTFLADPPASGHCSQCHDDWPGATHTFHQGFSCTNCHSGSDPVAPSSCSGCHGGASAIQNLHSSFEAPGDGNYCGFCHEGVNAETHSWGEVKALFH